MIVERDELRALADLGAPVVVVNPARERVLALLDSSPALRFVLAPVGCICSKGFGAQPDPRCGVHGIQ